MSDKPSAAWYLAPIFLGIIGSAIMWFVLKDEDHPDSPKMIKKGWIIGIALTVIPFLIWIPMMVMMPFAFMGVEHQDMLKQIPVPVERMVEPLVPAVTEPIQQKVPAPGFEDVPEMIVESENTCENEGGLWGIWGNAVDTSATCNPSTSDQGKECSDSTQCQSFCQAKEGSEINSESIGMCYGYELAICMQEVQNGIVQPEWCQ